MRQKAENAKPQIVADEYHAMRNKFLAAVGQSAETGRSLPRQYMIAAASKPYHDWQWLRRLVVSCLPPNLIKRLPPVAAAVR